MVQPIVLWLLAIGNTQKLLLMDGSLIHRPGGVYECIHLELCNLIGQFERTVVQIYMYSAII